VNSSKFVQLLNGCVEHLPVSTSLIPLYILCITLHHDEIGEDLTFKTLYTLLYRYSDVGIKNHMQILSRNGWIQIKQSKLDRRVKCIYGTQKLHTTFHRVIKENL
jgi:hypothetical protein